MLLCFRSTFFCHLAHINFLFCLFIYLHTYIAFTHKLSVYFYRWHWGSSWHFAFRVYQKVCVFDKCSVHLKAKINFIKANLRIILENNTFWKLWIFFKTKQQMLLEITQDILLCRFLNSIRLMLFILVCI